MLTQNWNERRCTVTTTSATFLLQPKLVFSSSGATPDIPDYLP